MGLEEIKTYAVGQDPEEPPPQFCLTKALKDRGQLAAAAAALTDCVMVVVQSDPAPEV